MANPTVLRAELGETEATFARRARAEYKRQKASILRFVDATAYTFKRTDDATGHPSGKIVNGWYYGLTGKGRVR